MPNVVKIGRTSRPAKKRAKELFSTGVPCPFDIEGVWRVRAEELNELETEIHGALEACRVHRKREFFLMEPGQAVEFVDVYLEGKCIGERGLFDSPLERWAMLLVVLLYFFGAFMLL